MFCGRSHLSGKFKNLYNRAMTLIQKVSLYNSKEKLITIARVSGEHVPDFVSLMILINACMLDVARNMYWKMNISSTAWAQ